MIVDTWETHEEHANISQSATFILQDFTSDSLVFILYRDNLIPRLPGNEVDIVGAY